MSGVPSPAETSMLRRAAASVARNLGWLLASRGVLAVLSLIYLGILTRVLGVAEFGRFALITTAAQSLAVFVGFQTWQIVVQYGVGHAARGDEAALARLLRACGILDLVSAVAGVAIGGLILYIWHDAIGIKPGLMRDTMIYLVVQLVTIRSMPLGILRLNDSFSLAALADSVTPAMRFVGALFIVAVVPTVKGFLYAWMVAEVATAIAYWALVWRSGHLRAAWRARAPLNTVLSENPGLWRFALTTNVNATLGLSGKQLPLLIVGASVGPQAAGGFRLASQLAQALAKLSQLMTRAAFPEIVRAIRGVSAELLLSLLGKMLAMSSVVAVVILAIVALLGKPALVLVGGGDYAGAYPILLWLALAGCIDLATVGFEPVLIAMHRSGLALAIRAVGVVAMAGAAFALIGTTGAEGAGIAVFAGSLVVGTLLTLASLGVARQRSRGDAD